MNNKNKYFKVCVVFAIKIVIKSILDDIKHSSFYIFFKEIPGHSKRSR